MLSPPSTTSPPAAARASSGGTDELSHSSLTGTAVTKGASSEAAAAPVAAWGMPSPSRAPLTRSRSSRGVLAST